MEPLQQPYNLFKAPQLTKPIQAYDPTKTVQQNMEGQGNPSAQNIINAYRTPQAQQQLQQQPAPVQQTQNAQKSQVNQPITSADDLARAMGYTSPQEEEKMRKASVANQRIMAVADALRQIGNIYNTVHYAPSQQFNSPVEMERQRYQQAKALRDRANQTYISYQQAKAAQDAKQRQWEAQFSYNAAKDARDYALKKNESDARANLNEAKIHRYNTLMELDQARREGIISDNEWRKRRAELYPQLTQSQIARNNRTGSGGGRSGGSGSKPTQWQTRYDDFDYANQNGIPTQEEAVDIFGTKTTRRRDPNVVHAEVEEHKRRNSGNGAGGGQGRFSSLSIHKK